MGPFVRVNGKLWHYGITADNRYPSNILPVDLKEGTWDCELARDWSAATNENKLQKGELTVQHAQNDVTVVTIRTPEGKPATYRIRFFAKKPHEAE